jgi:hypothetical protein
VPETIHTNDEPMVLRLGDVKEDGTPDIAKVLFTFPVPHRQMSVRQQVRIDQAEAPGRSGAIKQAVGYQDSEIDVAISLVDEEDQAGAVTRTALAQLEEIQRAFRDKTAKDQVPRIFSIQSPLTDALNIKTVLFSAMDAADVEGESRIELSLRLVEFEPVEVQKAKQQQPPAPKRNTSAGSEQSPTDTRSDQQAQEAKDEEESEFEAAFRQGKADAMDGEPEGPRS